MTSGASVAKLGLEDAEVEGARLSAGLEVFTLEFQCVELDYVELECVELECVELDCVELECAELECVVPDLRHSSQSDYIISVAPL